MQLIENKPVVVPDGSFVADGPVSHQIHLGNSSHCPLWCISSPSAPSSVHLRVVSCLDQVFHQLRSPLANCEDEPHDTLKLYQEFSVSGMVVVSVDPTNGPDRVDLESARMTSGEHCTYGARHWNSDTIAFGEPQPPRTHEARDVFRLRNCCIDPASLQ